MTISNDNAKTVRKKFHELQTLQNIISQSVLYSTTDSNGKIVSVSKAFENLTGYKESEVIGKSHNIFKTPDTPSEFYKQMWSQLLQNNKFEGEVKNYKKNKEEYWINLTIHPLFDEDGEKIGYASYRENITDKKKLEYISTHDTLTNIYNRVYFDTMLDQHIQKANTSGHQFGLMMLDIDYFKNINDLYGHNVGDTVLKKIAKILQENVDENEVAARWGGEEFVIIFSNNNKKNKMNLANKIREQLENSSILDAIEITASFGVGHYVKNESKTSFFERIDKALYTAKKNGRNMVIDAD
ncbi:MAG: diguanylate cyclase [Arcobacteraceae bacterium]